MKKNIRNDCTKAAMEIKEWLYKRLATGTVHNFTAFLINNTKCIDGEGNPIWINFRLPKLSADQSIDLVSKRDILNILNLLRFEKGVLFTYPIKLMVGSVTDATVEQNLHNIYSSCLVSARSIRGQALLLAQTSFRFIGH